MMRDFHQDGGKRKDRNKQVKNKVQMKKKYNPEKETWCKEKD